MRESFKKYVNMCNQYNIFKLFLFWFSKCRKDVQFDFLYIERVCFYTYKYIFIYIFSCFFPIKNEHPLSNFWLRTQDLLGMKYDKCISYKNGSIGKGQHARGQYSVLIDSSRIVVHPTIENDGPRGNEEHTAGDSKEYIDALVQFGLQQMSWNLDSHFS